MVDFKELGLRIFRLKESKKDDEYLLYNIKKSMWNFYSKTRIIDYIDLELREMDFNLKDYYIKTLGDQYKDKKLNISKIIESFLYEQQELIDSIGYAPIDEVIIIDNNKKLFNTYQKSNLLKTLKDDEGDFFYIKKLITNLVGENKEEYNYFIKWIGWQLQNPMKRLPTSIILQGEQGTGKTKFCELILKNIFGRNFCEIGQTDINKEWNEFIMGKQLIVANEVIHNDNKFLVPDKLKNYVTDEYLSISQRFKNTIYVRNYAQWVFTTNNHLPLKIEKGDRRYSVFKSKKLINGFEIIGSLIEDLENQLTHFVNYLLKLDIEYDEVATPIENKAKAEIIKASWDSVEEFINNGMDVGGFDILEKNLDSSTRFFTVHNNSTGSYVSAPDFYSLYKIFCVDAGHKPFSRRNFTRQLSILGFENGNQRIGENSSRVIYIKKNE